MRLKIWDRLRRETAADLEEAGETLAAARLRLEAARKQRDLAEAMKRQSDRTLAINHFGPMIDDAYGTTMRQVPPRNRRKGDLP